MEHDSWKRGLLIPDRERDFEELRRYEIRALENISTGHFGIPRCQYNDERQ